MNAAVSFNVLNETLSPTSADELAANVREAFANATPLYPLGGKTSLFHGLPPSLPGRGLSLSRLTNIVDYPARDMTITVEAGITMERLMETLAGNRQRLPIDVPHARTATLGGVIATNWNGPLRYGQGTVRDYVIGIHAVDGRGVAFKGGGRVVKNVAGYDFCKLLTGSLGTLGIIHQVTLKLKPMAERFSLLVCRIPNLPMAESILAALVHSQTMPVAIELLGGPDWRQEPSVAAHLRPDAFALVVAFEGAERDVAWQESQLVEEWRAQGIDSLSVLSPDAARSLWQKLIEFPALESAPLVLQASLKPSHICRLVEAALEVDASVSFQSHAGSGVVRLRFPSFPAAGLSRTLVGKLQPVAAVGAGQVCVLANTAGIEVTRHAVWGPAQPSWNIMNEVKKQFDPLNLLNPGRFIFA